jgi:hypothetical protein
MIVTKSITRENLENFLSKFPRTHLLPLTSLHKVKLVYLRTFR